MRTKILVTAAAALAVGLVSSNAQVLSANIVGYYNVPMSPGQYYLVGNQLVGTNNDLNTLLPSLPKHATASVWYPSANSFTNASKGGLTWVPDLTVPVGQAVWVSVPSAATNTFVGSVVTGPGGSVTNTLNAGTYYLSASPIPYAEDLNGTNINLVLPKHAAISVWYPSVNQFTNSSRGGTAWVPDQNISVGQGFWLSSPSTASWVQNLPSN